MMKKSFVTLVILGAFAGGAIAQSTLTLYGRMDVGYRISNGGRYENPSNDKFQMQGNGKTTSRWGMKGTEDLGNGLKTFFQLESKINPEDGASNSKLFDRRAILGLSGKFGTFQAGRQSTVLYNVLARYSANSDPNTGASLGYVRLAARQNSPTGLRSNSLLVYISPDFNGLKFQSSLGLKNNGLAKTYYSLGGNYKKGPLSIGLVYESKTRDNVDAAWGLGASYNFGYFEVNGGYLDNHRKEDGKGFYMGVKAPIEAFTVGAQLAYNTSIPEVAGQDKLKPMALELFVNYNLSKRTTAYGLLGLLNNDARDFDRASRKTSFAFGLVHSF